MARVPRKHYISAQDLLEDSCRLGAQIVKSGFRPDFVVGVWRGGAPVAIAVQEMLEYFGIQSDHISVRTSFYTGISETASKVRVCGLDYLVENLKPENALLVVDDVYDSGQSIQALLEELAARTRQNMPQQVRIAAPWYKSANNQTGREPDYYVHTTGQWLVFPHEIMGLSEEELVQGKGELMKIIQSVNCSG